MRPVIGLIPLFDEDKESYWMLPGYMKVLEACGALPIMLPLTDDEEELTQSVEMCDGLLLTGGHDVDPMLYHEQPKDTCGVPCRERDRMESRLLGMALKKDLPVLGICRGIQFMNGTCKYRISWYTGRRRTAGEQLSSSGSKENSPGSNHNGCIGRWSCGGNFRRRAEICSRDPVASGVLL